VEIVDAQVHLNQLVPDWRTADHDSSIVSSITAMDAVGIDTVLIAESRGFDSNMRLAIGRELPNGAIRGEFPFSERAVATYPDRFGYLVRIDPRDPELRGLVAEVRTKPGALCMRISPLPDTGEVDQLARGAFEPLFAAGEAYEVPMFVHLPGRSELLVPYLRKFPRLHVILDHCGVGVAPPTVGRIAPTLASSMTPTLAERLGQLEQVISLAHYPNLALKWCHAPAYLSAEAYPYRDVLPLLRKVLTAFGVERVMWASDYTHSRTIFPMSWAQSLHYLLGSDMLSDVEKEWLLGRSVRRVLRWPATP
jgi:predicted TIM-barrel fold metal-dependent hydrolase